MLEISLSTTSAGVSAVGPWLIVTIGPVCSAFGAVAPPVPTSAFPPANNVAKVAGSVAASGGESCQFQNRVRSIFSLEFAAAEDGLAEDAARRQRDRRLRRAERLAVELQERLLDVARRELHLARRAVPG